MSPSEEPRESPAEEEEGRERKLAKVLSDRFKGSRNRANFNYITTYVLLLIAIAAKVASKNKTPRKAGSNLKPIPAIRRHSGSLISGIGLSGLLAMFLRIFPMAWSGDRSYACSHQEFRLFSERTTKFNFVHC
jgi:hypothetical protein